MEEPAVVEAGQRVQVGELPRLAEPLRVVDRRRRPQREVLQRAEVLLPERAVGGAREDAQVPHRRRVARERHRQPGVDDGPVRLELLARVAVDEGDRAGVAAVRRAGDRLPLGLLRREAERRDERLPLVVRDADHGRVDPRHRAGGLERAGEHLVEVDRARELAQEAAPAAFLLRPLDRRHELLRHLVHAGREAGHELGDLRVGLLDRPPEHQQREEQDDERPQASRDRDQNRRHTVPPPRKCSAERALRTLVRSRDTGYGRKVINRRPRRPPGADPRAACRRTGRGEDRC